MVLNAKGKWVPDQKKIREERTKQFNSELETRIEEAAKAYHAAQVGSKDDKTNDAAKSALSTQVSYLQDRFALTYHP